MSITTTTHLNFRGEARAALEFYRSVFGGRLDAFTNEQAGLGSDPAQTDQLAWGQVVSEAGFHVMAFDVRSGTAYDPGANPVYVSVRGTDADEITGYWKSLAEGAEIVAPLAPSGWSPLYGMLRDRFGVTWVLDVEVAWAG